jgi:hypothetical protein
MVRVTPWLISDPESFGVTAHRQEMMAIPNPHVKSLAISHEDPL